MLTINRSDVVRHFWWMGNKKSISMIKIDVYRGIVTSKLKASILVFFCSVSQMHSSTFKYSFIDYVKGRWFFYLLSSDNDEYHFVVFHRTMTNAGRHFIINESFSSLKVFFYMAVIFSHLYIPWIKDLISLQILLIRDLYFQSTFIGTLNQFCIY